MTPPQIIPDWAGGLRGRLRAEAPLAPTVWLRAGGAADLLFRPADTADLTNCLAALPDTLPLAVLGAGSNVLVRDAGIPGLTIRLGGGFSAITTEPDGIIAGAAALDLAVAEAAAAASLSGLEFLCGIPGSIGGAVAMNAGAYGADLAAVLDWVDLATPAGPVRLPARHLQLGYRHASLPARTVVTRARLRAHPADPAQIAARMATIRAARTTTQPVRARTGGSTFRNPDPAESTLRAWELIDAAGCRGLRLGQAEISPLHCNFLINRGGATATELETLAEQVRGRVREASGITLAWEIKRIGRPALPVAHRHAA